MKKGICVKGHRVHVVIRQEVIRFAKWLRKEYDFPIKVPVYLSPHEEIISNGKKVTGAFFIPEERDTEPYIRIATGCYKKIRVDHALIAILNSVAHEVIHYLQWCTTGKTREKGVAQRAEKIVNHYFKNTVISSKATLEDHVSLIQIGGNLHERFLYVKALQYVEKAYRLAPQCPSAIYNLANVLHMVDRDKDAYELLQKIINSSIEELQQGCLECENPRSYQLDAYYLLFLVVLYWKRSWKDAFPYAEKHLHLRKQGHKSVWNINEIRKEITELRRIF